MALIPRQQSPAVAEFFLNYPTMHENLENLMEAMVELF